MTFPPTCLHRKQIIIRPGAACGLAALLSIHQSPNKHSDSLLLIKLLFEGNVAASDSTQIVHRFCVWINAAADQELVRT